MIAVPFKVIAAALATAAADLGAATQLPAPWEGAPFAGDPRAIAAAAGALAAPKDAAIDVLLEEGSFVFDERGRCVYTHRLVYRPLTDAAAQAWAYVEQAWSPWRQKRPEIRARVIAKDGQVYLLDPATIAEGGAGEDDQSKFSDRRVLRGPLPAVSAGSVVEEVTIVRETAPLFEGGVVRRYSAQREQNVRHWRLRLDAPASLPLRHRGHGLKSAPRKAAANGRNVVTYERTDLPPLPEGEPFVPPEEAQWPYIAFSTGISWADVTARYAEAVDRQLTTDLEALARTIAGSSGGPREKAQRLLAWIQANVRYTGLELGEAAIIPVSPAETLKRRYGDCKDLSLLLAGLLRASGHPAYVALIRSRWDEISPDLPGLGEFDHAIVVVPAKQPIWIDPTDPESPAGTLPLQDQGKLALVASKSTPELVRTPQSTSLDNRSVVVREIRLAEDGLAHVIETQELTGSIAASTRAERRQLDPAKRQRADEEYAKKHFVAAGATAVRFEGTEDPTQPLRIRSEADGSRWGVTGYAEAEAIVPPDSLFRRLPWPLRPSEPDEGGRTSHTPRKAVLVLPEPHSAELRFRVVPPPGFRAKPLPPDRSLRFGPATFRRASKLEGDGSVSVAYHFDSVSPRLAAAEVDAMRDGLQELVREKGPFVRFERVSAALMAAGKGREALAEMRRLAVLHPKEALHRIHLTNALLELGMGEAARREARKAVDLEPRSVQAHRTLSWALQHDLLGRHFEPGCDVAGARTALRRAVEVAPKDADARSQLAIVLEYDDKGERYGRGALLAEAIAQYRYVRDQLQNHEYDQNLLAVLLRAERFDEARKLAASLKPGAQRDAVLAAAAAAMDRAPAALREVASLNPDERRQALLQGALALYTIRHYAPASALLLEAAQGAPNSAQLRAQAALIGRFRRHEEIQIDDRDPASMVRRVFEALLLAPSPDQALRGLISEHVRSEQVNWAGELGRLRQTFRRNAAGLPFEVLVDAGFSAFSIQSDGGDRLGYRLRAVVPTGDTDTFTLYVVRERNAWRVVAADPDVGGLGGEALRRVEAGDLEGARRWLTWAREAQPARSSEGLTPGALLTSLWTRGSEADREELRAAAAALAAFSDDPGSAISVLEAALRRVQPGPQAKRLTWALARACAGVGQHERAVALAREMLAAEPGSEEAFDIQYRSLMLLHRHAEARAAAEARLRSLPNDSESTRSLAGAAMAQGDFATVERETKRLVERGQGTAIDYNNLAWVALFREPVAAEAITYARRAVELTREKISAPLHTLAVIYAAMGQPAEAKQTLLKSIEAQGGEPRLDDWLAVGYMAEYYGLLDIAEAAYRRVRSEHDQGPATSRALAERRLSRLGATASR